MTEIKSHVEHFPCLFCAREVSAIVFHQGISFPDSSRVVLKDWVACSNCVEPIDDDVLK